MTPLNNCYIDYIIMTQLSRLWGSSCSCECIDLFEWCCHYL